MHEILNSYKHVYLSLGLCNVCGTHSSIRKNKGIYLKFGENIAGSLILRTGHFESASEENCVKQSILDSIFASIILLELVDDSYNEYFSEGLCLGSLPIFLFLSFVFLLQYHGAFQRKKKQ